MTRVATSWLVYRLTHSALLLGTVGFAGQIPSFLLAPVAGVIVDRYDRRQVLVWTQALNMVQSLALAVLTLMHVITIAEIVVLSILQGAVNAFDMPARQSFMIKMVNDREDLSNAIAMNSSMVNATRLIGPALAGVMIAATGEGWCFGVDGVSYIAVIASLLLMRIARDEQTAQSTSMAGQLAEGWRYVAGSLPIRNILLLFAMLSLMGWPFMVLMPIFAAQVLHGGAHTLGFLSGAVGVGSLACAITMLMRRTVRGLARMLPIGAIVFGLGLVGFGLSTKLWLSLAIMLVVGFGMMQGLTASNTILQTLVDEKMRGRVMSYYTMAFVGMAPFGSLLSGALAHWMGAERTVVVSGVACVVGGVWFALRLPALRPELHAIYQRNGVLPQRG